jgi:ankyrin repeat protein
MKMQAIKDNARSIMLKHMFKNHMWKEVVPFLQENVHISIIDDHSMSLFHFAIIHGAPFSILELILEGGLDINILDGMLWSPIYDACDRNRIPYVKWLLDHGANPNGKEIICDTSDGTPLHYATARGHLECVQLLVCAGASVNLENGYTNTALHLAAHGGHVECMKFLIENGANVNALNWYQETPLHNCHHKPECVKLLLEKGADVHLGRSQLYKIVCYGLSDKQDKSWTNYLQSMDYLLAHGCDINKLDFSGDSILHCAVVQNKADAIEALLDRGANVNIVNNLKKSPIFKAVDHAHVDCVKKLIRSGADVLLQSEYHRALLDYTYDDGYVHYECGREIQVCVIKAMVRAKHPFIVQAMMAAKVCPRLSVSSSLKQIPYELIQRMKDYLYTT